MTPGVAGSEVDRLCNEHSLVHELTMRIWGAFCDSVVKRLRWGGAPGQRLNIYFILCGELDLRNEKGQEIYEYRSIEVCVCVSLHDISE